MSLDSSGIHHIRQAMAGLKGAEARAQARALAKAYGVTETTIYRHSGAARTTRERATRGKARKAVDAEALTQMVRKSVVECMAATDIVELAEANGWIEPGQITAAWLTRYLKSHGISRKDLLIDRRPYSRFEAAEPNQVFQIDATMAEQFYLDDDGSIDWEGRGSRNKNRPGNRKTRLYIIGIIDDNSRCIYAEFTTSVTTNDWLRFEFNCFRRKDDPRFIFHGLPRTLYMDNDAVAESEKFKRAHAMLGIRVIKHRPTKKTDRFSNARSKGKIERTFLYFAQKQAITKFKKFRSLEEANRFLLAICHQKNNRVHSETGEAPYARWIRITDERLIHCEDEKLYKALYRDRRECMVYGDLTIRMGGEKYQLPAEAEFYRMIKQKVTVYSSPFDTGSMTIAYQGREYEIPLSGSDIRDWRQGPLRHEQTPLEQKVAALEQTEPWAMKVWGELEEEAAGREVSVMPFSRGTALDTSGMIAEAPRRRRVEAMLSVAGDLGRPLRPDEARMLNGAWGDWVTDEEIETALAEIRAPRMAEVKAG